MHVHVFCRTALDADIFRIYIIGIHGSNIIYNLKTVMGIVCRVTIEDDGQDGLQLPQLHVGPEHLSADRLQIHRFQEIGKVPEADTGRDNPVVNTYLRARSIWLIRHNVDDSKIRPLFFRMCGDYDYMSANNIRKVKTIVERNLGVKFSLRDCRRAFGQRYVDHDAAMADVSHLMGHKTTRTTEMYYCRRSDDDVFRSVKGKW